MPISNVELPSSTRPATVELEWTIRLLFGNAKHVGRAVGVADHQVPTLRAETQRNNRTGQLPLETLFAGGCVPEDNSPALVCGCQQTAIGAKRQMSHLCLVLLERVDQFEFMDSANRNDIGMLSNVGKQ